MSTRREILATAATAMAWATMGGARSVFAETGAPQADSPQADSPKAKTPDADSPRSNLIFIVADDQSWHSLACMGDPLLKTPNIDGLARRGVTFTRACVTTSICMVSRASYLTGQWLSVMGGARVTPQMWPDTWPARLRAAGYWAGHIGKVHVSGHTGANYDYWAGHGGGSWAKDEHGQTVHSIQNDTGRALTFLRSRPKDKPFFLQISYTVPHAQDNDPRQYIPMPQEESLYTSATVTPPKTATDAAWKRMPPFFDDGNESRRRWRKRFDTPEKYQAYAKNYFRLISGMDRSIGVILDELKAQGADARTIIVFTGDNGYFLGEHGLADKWYAYEESLRVPLIVADPRLPPGRRGARCDDIALNVDLAPTFCAFAGLKPPAAMQGRDLTPLLFGQTPPGWRKDFLYQFIYGAPRIPSSEAVCSKEWKFIRWFHNDNYEELFDLHADPYEENDLAKAPAHAAQLQAMRDRLEQLKKEVGGAPLDAVSPRAREKAPKAGRGKSRAKETKP